MEVINKIYLSNPFKLLMMSIYSIYAFVELGFVGLGFVLYIMSYTYGLEQKINYLNEKNRP